MQTWIALLRGINVGGKNLLPMAELRSDLESLNLENVRTYLQSGNVVFDSAATTTSALRDRIAHTINERHGLRPKLVLLDHADLLRAIEHNPFPEAISDPKTLHFFFLAEPPSDPDSEAIDKAKAASERFKVTDGVFYLHAPDGFGRSKLAARAEKFLGIVATARNYRTVEKLLAMVTQG